MPNRLLTDENYIFITKIIIPASLAIWVKLAIEMKKDKTKASFLNIILSMVIGVGGAYFLSDIILNNCKNENVPVIIALIAITSEKIGEFIIYKFNIDGFLTAVIDGFFEYITGVFKQNK